MRTIIAGSRNITSLNTLKEAIKSCPFNITTVISGHARGVDQLGEVYAYQQNIPCELHPANWDLHGKSAGYKRNEQMAKVAEACVILWDGQSKGTKHMIDLARKYQLTIHLVIINGEV